MDNKVYLEKVRNSTFLDNVCMHIHYKKLRRRIRGELSDHMEDMLDEIKEQYPNEADAMQAVREHMGNPDELGKELKRANKPLLMRVLILRISIIILLVLSFPIIYSFIYDVFDDIRTYTWASDIETREQMLSEEYNDGKPIKLLVEYENNGYKFRFYVPTEQDENENKLLSTASIKFLGISIYDKFGDLGCSTWSSQNDYRIPLYDKPFIDDIFDDYIHVLTGDTEAKYIKVYYEPIDKISGLEPYWSDFIAIPQGATYEQPIIIHENTPEGYYRIRQERFDENKKIVTDKILIEPN